MGAIVCAQTRMPRSASSLGCMRHQRTILANTRCPSKINPSVLIVQGNPILGIKVRAIIGKTVPPKLPPQATIPKAVFRFALNQWLTAGIAPPKTNPEASPVARPCTRKNCQNLWHSATRKVESTRRTDAVMRDGWKKPVSNRRPTNNPGAQTKAY